MNIFLWLGNSAWDILGKILVQGFFGVLIFAPIQPTLSLEILSAFKFPFVCEYGHV